MAIELTSFLQIAEQRNPNEPEFLQAVKEITKDLIPFINEHSVYKNQNILERMIEPERVISFKVPWVDDARNIQVNRGYRIQMNSAIGPYKGGLRFHPTVNQSILKFLGFEQVFKNSLTSLPMGGGKGGANFDPKGKSDEEVMRFCQSFMTELSKHIGANTDVPAGDIGVGGREIGYLFGQYKRLSNTFEGVLTGKELSYGGSLIRPEATGYGTVYFAQYALQHVNDDMKGKNVVISGSGNVAQYTTAKAIQLGAKVLTVSDSSGFIYDKDGINEDKLSLIMYIKNQQRKRISEYIKTYPNAEYHEGKKPWGVACDVAFPCATQNELGLEDAKTLLKNGCMTVCEGANMPCTLETIHEFVNAKIIHIPGKASNAGGVAVSGLEMTQNSLRYSWSKEEVDTKLQDIMKNIHQTCVDHGQENGHINYLKGANIGGFVKVADAMISQGVV